MLCCFMHLVSIEWFLKRRMAGWMTRRKTCRSSWGIISGSIPVITSQVPGHRIEPGTSCTPPAMRITLCYQLMLQSRTVSASEAGSLSNQRIYTALRNSDSLREMCRSNPGRDANYLQFSCFSSVISQKCNSKANQAPTVSFYIHSNSLFISDHTLDATILLTFKGAT
jgi:hypothetical protein